MMRAAQAVFTMPLGIIEEANERGATFVMTRPDDGQMIMPGAGVTVWDEDQASGAVARYRGTISEIGETIGAFVIDDQDIDENWPNHLNPISPGNAVYLAQGHTYTPDPNRMASEREMIEMMDLATQFERDAGVSTGAGMYQNIQVARTNAPPHE